MCENWGGICRQVSKDRKPLSNLHVRYENQNMIYFRNRTNQTQKPQCCTRQFTEKMDRDEGEGKSQKESEGMPRRISKVIRNNKMSLDIFIHTTASNLPHPHVLLICIVWFCHCVVTNRSAELKKQRCFRE